MQKEREKGGEGKRERERDYKRKQTFKGLVNVRGKSVGLTGLSV